MIGNKGLSLHLCSVLLCLLAACNDTESTRNATARGPAQHLPSGEAALPPAGVDATSSMAPADVYRAFRSLETPGVRVHLTGPDSQPELLLVEVDLEQFEPVVVGTDGKTRPGVSAAEAIAAFELDLLVGSSFVSELHSLTPVGLLQIEGRIISELQGHGYTRVLGTRADGVGVVATREFHRGMFESAMQVGPGVVEQGKLDISERDLERPEYFRSFVGTCGATAIIGASQMPMHLYTLGRHLLEFTAGIGQHCDEVVNLAGDREVILAVASADASRFAYFGHPLTAKAALLGFRRRHP